MEEADALCSRVGIMVKGELRCIGSTQHLKNLYGAGYTLEMKLLGGDCTPTTPSGDRIAGLKEFVAGLFPDATLEESFADRLVFAVPQHAVNSLAECFTQLEKGEKQLEGIEEFLQNSVYYVSKKHKNLRIFILETLENITIQK